MSIYDGNQNKKKKLKLVLAKTNFKKLKKKKNMILSLILQNSFTINPSG